MTTHFGSWPEHLRPIGDKCVELSNYIPGPGLKASWRNGSQTFYEEANSQGIKNIVECFEWCYWYHVKEKLAMKGPGSLVTHIPTYIKRPGSDKWRHSYLEGEL